MTNFKDLLREADPVRLEPALTPESRDAMRRAIVAAAGTRVHTVSAWRQPLALAAMTVFAVMGATAAHRIARQQPPVADIVRPPVAAEAATQVHFRTPGGTRIIWTLDPAFQIGGTAR